jgi:hypothetical protein
MCEFCSVGPNRVDRDSTHSDFEGFFSAAAIEAAVRQVNADQTSQESNSDSDSDDDTDGT